MLKIMWNKLVIVARICSIVSEELLVVRQCHLGWPYPNRS